MNQKAKCHQIQGCSIYIDAFRSDAFKNSGGSNGNTSTSTSTFILTHYHSDHYTGLPRGSSSRFLHHKIHCTPITASLLREIHGIDPKYIVEHRLGETWTHNEQNSEKGFSNENDFATSSSSSSSSTNKNVARITFYDANHCPGAAIVHVVDQRNKHYVHTGDFRFHQHKFSTYTEIQKSIQQRCIDVLYLDTTYSKPKHDFLPQEEAVQSIALQVKQLLSGNSDAVQLKKRNFFQPRTKIASSSASVPASAYTQGGNGNGNGGRIPQRTLVLLSCYSIGKEKVLWHSAVESNQKIYVNKTKYKMLQCIQEEHERNIDDFHVDGSEIPVQSQRQRSIDDGETPYNDIITKCTTNPKESDLHVIQMGTAGSLFPYFKPDFQQCALYAHQLNKGYQKVVAFLPTGWAANNKKNNRHSNNNDNDISSDNTTVATKKIPMEDLKDLLPPRTAQKGCYGNDSSIHVEVRLVPYSEHSSYSELRSCVKYLRPRQVVPTVFSNEKDYRDIEHRFHDLIDSQRAKAAFIRSIAGGAAGVVNTKSDAKRNLARVAVSKEVNNNNERNDCSVRKEKDFLRASNKCNVYSAENDLTRTLKGAKLKYPMNKKRKASCSSRNSSTKMQKIKVDDGLVATLVSMGFDTTTSFKSLEIKRNNLDAAIEWLLLQGKTV